MLLPNARRILKMGPSLTTFKLLLIAAASSRPSVRKICLTLLHRFEREGEIPIQYSIAGRDFTAFVRSSEMSSDYLTVSELVLGNVYSLDADFIPDVVIDCGGNIGLFSMAASAIYPDSTVVICEPVPSNLQQIQKHFRINHVAAEILPICIGGSRRTIPFFVRDAIAGSFDPNKPYTEKLEIEVWTLADVLDKHKAERILLKLDIEGMEIEALQSFLPTETRPVRIVGELHDHHANVNRFEKMFRDRGWTLRFSEITNQGSIFEAFSPSAVAKPS